MRLAVALAALSLGTAALADGGPINLSVTCKAAASGTSVNITGFVVKGSTKDWQEGAALAGKAALVEVTKDGKVVASGKNLKVKGRQDMTPRGASFDFRVTVPGKDPIEVIVDPQGTVDLVMGKGGDAKTLDATCEQKGWSETVKGAGHDSSQE